MWARNLGCRVSWDIYRSSVNKLVALLPILMADDKLFSVHVNNVKILSREKIIVRGWFFPFFLAHHHLSTHTENTFNFESHILQGPVHSHNFYRWLCFLTQKKKKSKMDTQSTDLLFLSLPKAGCPSKANRTMRKELLRGWVLSSW